MKDKETFPMGGVTEGVKTKTNYGLVGGIFGGLVAALGIICWQLADPLSEILAVPLVIAIIIYAFCAPHIMKQMPPSEEYKVRMARLGYYEADGNVISIKELHLTSAQNPRQLPPAPPKAKEDVTKE